MGRERPERDRRLALPRRPRTGRRAPLPRPHEPGQGRAPRDRVAQATRPPARHRRQVPRAGRDRRTSTSSSRPTSTTTSATSARSTTTRKCDLLAEAHALLVPIEWEEPFGLVMIEALACGTPVVAMRRGSVPEILGTAKRPSSPTISPDGRTRRPRGRPRPGAAAAGGRDAVLGRTHGRGLPRSLRDDARPGEPEPVLSAVA